MAYTYTKSRELFDRAIKVIPCGIYGHLGVGRSRMIPVESYPFYCSKAEGTYVWDVDGNKFLDFGAAYGPNVLGYKNPIVEAAVTKQTAISDCTTLVSPLTVELAELLVDTVNCADWAFFAKNGSDATTLAILTARAATGRKKIVMMNSCYHGVHQWCQKKGDPGCIDEDVANNIFVDFNNFEMLEQVVNEHKGEIAGLISMPYHHTTFFDNIMPDPDYWKKVRKLCTDNGIVLIFDDVRAGFRMDIAGSDHFFGIKADMICLAKAIANGYTLSAVCGCEALKSTVESLKYTGSYWFAGVPIAASIATINRLKEIDGVNYMINLGTKFTEGLKDVAKANDLEIVASGLPSLFFLRLVDPDYSLIAHQEWIGEMVKRGVFMMHYHNMFINCAMTEDDINHALEVADVALNVVKKNHPEIIVK